MALTAVGLLADLLAGGARLAAIIVLSLLGLAIYVVQIVRMGCW